MLNLYFLRRHFSMRIPVKLIGNTVKIPVRIHSHQWRSLENRTLQQPNQRLPHDSSVDFLKSLRKSFSFLFGGIKQRNCFVFAPIFMRILSISSPSSSFLSWHFTWGRWTNNSFSSFQRYLLRATIFGWIWVALGLALIPSEFHFLGFQSCVQASSIYWEPFPTNLPNIFEYVATGTYL